MVVTIVITLVIMVITLVITLMITLVITLVIMVITLFMKSPKEHALIIQKLFCEHQLASNPWQSSQESSRTHFCYCSSSHAVVRFMKFGIQYAQMSLEGEEGMGIRNIQ